MRNGKLLASVVVVVVAAAPHRVDASSQRACSC